MHNHSILYLIIYNKSDDKKCSFFFSKYILYYINISDIMWENAMWNKHRNYNTR